MQHYTKEGPNGQNCLRLNYCICVETFEYCKFNQRGFFVTLSKYNARETQLFVAGVGGGGLRR